MKGLIGLAAFRTPFIPWYIRDRDQDRDRGVRGFGFVMVHVMEGVLWTFKHLDHGRFKSGKALAL
jgi:hypothetical protein